MSVISNEYRKVLMEKRKYYSEHPEESKRAYFESHYEDYAPIAKSINDKNKKND